MSGVGLTVSAASGRGSVLSITLAAAFAAPMEIFQIFYVIFVVNLLVAGVRIREKKHVEFPCSACLPGSQQSSRLSSPLHLPLHSDIASSPSTATPPCSDAYSLLAAAATLHLNTPWSPPQPCPRHSAPRLHVAAALKLSGCFLLYIFTSVPPWCRSIRRASFCLQMPHSRHIVVLF